MSEYEDRPELSQDALVEALVLDPDDVPGVAILQGLPGRGGAATARWADRQKT
jgi:hypothetical protein